MTIGPSRLGSSRPDPMRTGNLVGNGSCISNCDRIGFVLDVRDGRRIIDEAIPDRGELASFFPDPLPREPIANAGRSWQVDGPREVVRPPDRSPA
jgi:hypothetical protein